MYKYNYIMVIVMLKIYNIIDKEEYLEEIVTLTINEWGKIPNNIEELNTKINKKIRQIKVILRY